MKISYNWLRQYVKTDLSAQEVSKILTAIGLEVEHEERIGGLFAEGLVVGEVLVCEKHPQADKLHCTQVNVGGERPLAIVCGAPNVAKGQKVVVATIGTKLSDHEGNSFTIKKAKLRGEVSEGMLCAEDEIGVGTSHEGIMILPPESVVGTRIADLFTKTNDTIFEIGLTANRADAMSHYGVARDLAAYLNQHSPCKAHLPQLQPMQYEPWNTDIRLGIVDSRRCIRYCGLTIRGVEVKPSPEWLRQALEGIGVRSINNVVDITNYVLHEVGNPLHAFDLQAFTKREVSVHTLPADTKFVTLDERERTLRETDLCICDGDTPLCLAGILGGANSGVTEKTRDIFLEAAVFEPRSLRSTARAHGLNTDASFRFERGIDPQFTEYALERAAQLIVELAGGTVGLNVNYYPEHLASHKVHFNLARAKRLLGYEMANSQIQKIFEGLEIAYTDCGNGEWDLEVPYYRIDVTREADLVEELLRIGGFPPLGENRIAFALDSGNNYRRPHIECVKDLLVGAGFQEFMGLSLIRGEDAQQLEPLGSLVQLLNPLSSDLDTLRNTLLFGALDTVARNVTRQKENLRLFEVGSRFVRTKGGVHESTVLCLVLTGELEGATWLGEARKATIFELKGYVEGVLGSYGLPYSEVEYAFMPQSNCFDYHVHLFHHKEVLTTLAQVSQILLKRFGIKIPVFYAEFALDPLERFYSERKFSFVPLPRFPEVRRDLSLLLDQRVTFHELQRAAFSAEPRLLRDVVLFDVYEGKGIPEGRKSYAMSFLLQDTEKTLTDKAIDTCMQKLLAVFNKEFSATLR